MRAYGTLFGVAVVLASGLVLSSWATSDDERKRRFDEAVELAEDGDYVEAIVAMEEVLRVLPDSPHVLWNLGLWYVELEDYGKALEIWKRYRRASPNDWQGRAKLIQAYEALDRPVLRDEEREALIEWYSKAEDDFRPRWGIFCREQFRFEDQSLMVFEYFEPVGDRRVFLRFSVLDENGEESSWYSLGSYDVTTEIARAAGHVAETERVYHLDHYAPGFHATLAFYNEMPDYETVRSDVIAALEGELKPVSATRATDASPSDD